MNYWMGPFSINIFIIFLFHLSCGEQGEAEMGKHFAKSFECFLPLWTAPWFEVLFPSPVVSLPQGRLLMPLLFKRRVTLFSNIFFFTSCLFYFDGKRKPRGLLKGGSAVALKCALSLSCNGQPSSGNSILLFEVMAVSFSECLSSVSSSEWNLRRVQCVENSLPEQWWGSCGSCRDWSACVCLDPLVGWGTSLQQR